MPRRFAFLCVLLLTLSASAVAQQTTPDSSLFLVDGLALYGHVRFESQAYREYQCSPSDKFPGFTWCHKEKTEKTNRGEVTFANSILHNRDGTAVYVNRYIEPASFGPNEVRTEIDRLSAKFGQPAREFRMPQTEGLPNAVIAVWGKIQLHQLSLTEVATVASGGRRDGILVSFLGDLERSAKAGVPVYQLVGGAGFLWAAAFRADGRGVLRFVTIDALKITDDGQIAANVTPQTSPTTEPKVNPSAQPAQPKSTAFNRLLEVPNSCLSLRAGWSSSVPKIAIESHRGITCPMKKDCLDDFSHQINVLLDYLRARSLLTAELHNQATAVPSVDSLLAGLQNIVSLYNRSSPPNVSVRDCVGSNTVRGSCDFVSGLVVVGDLIGTGSAQRSAGLLLCLEWARAPRQYDPNGARHGAAIRTDWQLRRARRQRFTTRDSQRADHWRGLGPNPSPITSGLSKNHLDSDHGIYRYTAASSLARPASPVGRPRRAITISAMMLRSAVAIR